MEGPIQLRGTVIEELPDDMFQVKLPNGHVVISRPSGQLRKSSIHLQVGDSVQVELSHYDLSRARITGRQP